MRVHRYAHGITGGKGLAARWMDLTITAPASALWSRPSPARWLLLG